MKNAQERTHSNFFNAYINIIFEKESVVIKKKRSKRLFFSNLVVVVRMCFFRIDWNSDVQKKKFENEKTEKQKPGAVVSIDEFLGFNVRSEKKIV